MCLLFSSSCFDLCLTIDKKVAHKCSVVRLTLVEHRVPKFSSFATKLLLSDVQRDVLCDHNRLIIGGSLNWKF